MIKTDQRNTRQQKLTELTGVPKTKIVPSYINNFNKMGLKRWTQVTSQTQKHDRKTQLVEDALNEWFCLLAAQCLKLKQKNLPRY